MPAPKASEDVRTNEQIESGRLPLWNPHVRLIAEVRELRRRLDALEGRKSTRKSQRPFRKRAATKRTQRFAEIRKYMAFLWKAYPNYSHKQMYEYADKLQLPVLWDDCSSWEEAFARHETAVKSFLSKAKHTK